MKCPECGNGDVHTESGEEIIRRYRNGMIYDVVRTRLPRMLFCPKCQEMHDISKKGGQPTSRRANNYYEKEVKNV